MCGSRKAQTFRAPDFSSTFAEGPGSLADLAFGATALEGGQVTARAEEGEG
jgi:hypothetical protein